MQTKGQLMKSLNTAFSFAPPSILFLTISIFVSIAWWHEKYYDEKLGLKMGEIEAKGYMI